MHIGPPIILPRTWGRGKPLYIRQIKVFVAHRRVGIVQVSRDYLGENHVKPGRRVGKMPGFSLCKKARHALLRLVQRQPVKYRKIIGESLLHGSLRHSENQRGIHLPVQGEERIPVMLRRIIYDFGLLGIDGRHLDHGKLVFGLRGSFSSSFAGGENRQRDGKYVKRTCRHIVEQVKVRIFLLKCVN